MEYMESGSLRGSRPRAPSPAPRARTHYVHVPSLALHDHTKSRRCVRFGRHCLTGVGERRPLCREGWGEGLDSAVTNDEAAAGDL